MSLSLDLAPRPTSASLTEFDKREGRRRLGREVFAPLFGHRHINLLKDRLHHLKNLGGQTQWKSEEVCDIVGLDALAGEIAHQAFQVVKIFNNKLR